MQGGPGCSGMMSLFYETGPYKVLQNLTLVENPFSWTSKYSMLYLDSPVFTGFSYANNNSSYVTNEQQIAEDLYATVSLFLKRFPNYSKTDFYIFGESMLTFFFYSFSIF